MSDEPYIENDLDNDIQEMEQELGFNPENYPDDDEEED